MRDFIWVTTKEPHAERREKILKKYPEIKTLMKHEPLTKYIAASLVALQTAIAIQFNTSHISETAFWLTAYLIGGSVHQILLLCCHEASHNLCFKSYFLNKCFGLFMNLPMIVPHFTFFKFYHREHHKNQGKEGIDGDLPTRFEAKLLSNPLGKIFFLFFHMWFYAIRPVLIYTAPFTKWLLCNYITQSCFTFLLYQQYGLGPIVYLLASDHFAGSIHPLAFHFIGEHYVFNKEDETYSYYGPLNWITLNVGYHNEHHDFPSIPWSQLPQLKRIATVEYSNVPQHKSYSYMIWQFLTCREKCLFSRVKRK